MVVTVGHTVDRLRFKDLEEAGATVRPDLRHDRARNLRRVLQTAHHSMAPRHLVIKEAGATHREANGRNSNGEAALHLYGKEVAQACIKDPGMVAQECTAVLIPLPGVAQVDQGHHQK